MYFRRKHILVLVVTLAITFFLSFYKLDYYIYQPGDIRALDGVVKVEEGSDSEGEMNLVTVRGGQATPLFYLMAKIRPYFDIYDLEDVRPEGISQDEYMEAQLHFMESSQEAATVVAFQAAGEELTINYQGVYVGMVMEDMPAEGVLQSGDQIVKVEGQQVNSAEEVIELTSSKSVGDELHLTISREDKEMDLQVELVPLGDTLDRPGIGISLVTDREIVHDREVTYDSGRIGGPSAGLIFSLEVYDQLVDEDITKGYQIVATGEIDYDGKVYPIGGIDKKVVAADDAGADIFLAPNEGGKKGSNYEVAKKTAEDIETDMKIIPIDQFQDAVDYLESLPVKEE
ncbi:SepM family pheromone-processing serine protease [Allobacillus sp. GCM10007491]|uniref:endopeptidase La n=1 Tax=Allobacillus saliphilus TaxID=2912308 RepID=A0A941CUG8_9BACI|nr:SepM family pheromone-processing serine protease [Allobacillus saliphilus]MBR7552781.1 PDZ domain-containing protein [Allobacillus saliphilus]